ncbi:hypothetical protein PG994_011318 [Apiospora phragmitis]|uniref:Uncharacterized protein n=1 Tax=Apiospora phragmitis TaxID=2905665 RepID=A0ABR1TSH2_9PEZI
MPHNTSPRAVHPSSTAKCQYSATDSFELPPEVMARNGDQQLAQLRCLPRARPQFNKTTADDNAGPGAW